MRYLEFAERFKKACIDADMPKPAVALGKILGVSSTMVYNYRNGEKLPSTDTLAKIATLLNVSIDWLINGREPFTAEEIRLIELYRESSNSAKRIITGTAEAAAPEYTTEENTKAN